MSPGHKDDDLQGTDIFEREVLEALDDFELTGDGLHLLEALRRLCQYRIAAPVDLYLALKEVLERYHSGSASTLDEAFNVSRPRYRNGPAERSKRAKAPLTSSDEDKSRFKWLSTPGIPKIVRLFKRAEELSRSGIPIDQGLWDTLADEFHISPSRARDWYYEAKALIKG